MLNYVEQWLVIFHDLHCIEGGGTQFFVDGDFPKFSEFDTNCTFRLNHP